MRVSDHLFLLIKSLNKSEKRYFKIFSSLQSGNKNYLKLFEAIEKQKEYDEHRIKAQYSEELFIKQLTRTKIYLYDLIMKSLELQHSGAEAELRRLCNQIEILYEKGLYSHCENSLYKALKLSHKHEKFTLLLGLYDWELKLIYAQQLLGKTEKDLKKIFREKGNAIDKYINQNKYQFVAMKHHVSYMQKGYSRKDTDRIISTIIIDHPLMKNESMAKSFHALMLYNQVRSAGFGMLGNAKKAYESIKKVILLFEKYPHQIDENIGYYSSALHNLGLISLMLKKYDELPPLFHKLRTTKTSSVNHTKKMLFDSIYLELELFIEKTDYEAGLKTARELEPEIEKEFERLKKQNTPNEYQPVICLCFARIYFANKDYRGTIRYLNKMLEFFTEIKNDLRNDLFSFTKIFSLITHYEMENTELLGYSIKSVYRFLHKKEKLYKFEEAFLKFISKNLHETNNENLQSAFEQFRNDLLKIFQDPFEKNVLEFFDLISWLDSKIQNRPFVDILKEKIKKQNLPEK